MIFAGGNQEDMLGDCAGISKYVYPVMGLQGGLHFRSV